MFCYDDIFKNPDNCLREEVRVFRFDLVSSSNYDLLLLMLELLLLLLLVLLLLLLSVLLLLSYLL